MTPEESFCELIKIYTGNSIQPYFDIERNGYVHKNLFTGDNYIYLKIKVALRIISLGIMKHDASRKF